MQATQTSPPSVADLFIKASREFPLPDGWERVRSLGPAWDEDFGGMTQCLVATEAQRQSDGRVIVSPGTMVFFDAERYQPCEDAARDYQGWLEHFAREFQNRVDALESRKA